jgi:hypothetical protein
MVLKVVTVHIKSGESLSDGADCTKGSIIRLAAPRDAWDGANLTFQVSTDNSPNYHDLVDSSGRAIQVSVALGCSSSIRGVEGLDPGWYKIRSGTKENPTKQSGNRDFSFVLLVPDAP